MRSSLGVVAFWALGLLALAGACIASIAFVGKQIDDTTVAVGYSLTPAQIDARLEAARRAFEAMTPAQHLDAARIALAPTGPREDPHALDEAERQLAAIAPTAPEHAQAAVMQADIDSRRIAFARAIGWLVERFGVRHPTTAPAEAPEQRSRLAHMLERRGRAGVVRAVGEPNVTLEFGGRLCGEALLAPLNAPAPRAVLRRVGVTRVQCATGGVGFAP